ncbi:hypothetical protein LOD99_14068 [Oopsacas minuta]|uniref:Peptidase M28 domain-containing protein n=1 Tax=Oopsacas minuta TaxID=111878 RepID=A0AAV7KJV4_9METZ|nr:hypothetical protein LOD99_14068 [Oopsacas minuta]
MGIRVGLIVVLLSSLLIQSASSQGSINVAWTPLNETSTTSYRNLINRFTTARNYGSEGYIAAQNYIRDWYTELNMTVVSQEFDTFNDNVTGVNLIGILHGKKQTQNFFLVGAHYDTMKDNPGVTDNGSGMSAVLEIARILNVMFTYNCTIDYSVIFVGFDMSKPEPDYGDDPPCPLSAGIGPCGVFNFIDWLEKYLTEQDNAQLLGTFIIDSILNYNTSINSQIISEDARVLLPDYFYNVSSGGYKGNYIAGVVRAADVTLAQTFRDSWVTMPLNELYQFQQVDLVGDATPNPNVHIQLPTFFQSEHMQLWAENHIAMLITDTLKQRGYQQTCFDKSCDNLQFITETNYEFGYQTVRAIADSIFKLGSGNCNTTIPPSSGSSLLPSLITFISVHFVAFILFVL